LLGEYGESRHQYKAIESPARAVTDCLANSCRFGFESWLYWVCWPANADAATEPGA
jgi:hypothetical protein